MTEEEPEWIKQKRLEDAPYGPGFGIKAICQNCGNKTRIRLQRGCSVKAVICIKCGKQAYKRAWDVPERMLEEKK